MFPRWSSVVSLFLSGVAMLVCALIIGKSLIVQRSARVDAPGCVNAAGKLGRSDKLQQ